MLDLINLMWGKSNPKHTLIHHMVDSGNVALCLLSIKPFKNIEKKFIRATGCSSYDSKAWIAYIIALHDIGKADGDFQGKNGDLSKPLKDSGVLFKNSLLPHYRHEVRSSEYVNKLLENEGWGRKARNTVSQSILCHHGNFKDGNIENNGIYVIAWDAYRDEIANELKKVFNTPLWSPTNFTDYSTAGILLSGLIVLSDWIASNEELMDVNDFDCTLSEYARYSMDKAKMAVKKLGFCETPEWEINSRFNDIWKSDTFKELRPIQKKCVDIADEGAISGLTIIEAGMGEGKTEGAIYLAVRQMAAMDYSGMYVALPTAATSNQMFTRVKEFLDQHSTNAAVNMRLVHGMSWLVDEVTLSKKSSGDNDGDSYDNSSWFQPAKRALLAPYSVGTIDQCLMSVLNVKFGFLRLFGLSNKTLLIDEVHAYDTYMSTILMLLLSWCSCLDIPVILLSATLPYQKKKELLKSYDPSLDFDGISDKSSMSSYPLITSVNAEGQVKISPVSGSSKNARVEVITHAGITEDPDSIASLAMELTKNGGCLCVIMNTVASAQQVYNSIKYRKDDGIELVLFHSRYRAEKRADIESRVLKLYDKGSLLSKEKLGHNDRPFRSILVATQVVEQSLDLDFDEMITEIAPIDLILQRSGRLHRHDRESRPTGLTPKLHVLLPANGKPKFGKSKKIYDRFIMLRTLRALSTLSSINIPKDIRCLVEDVYAEFKPSKEKLTDDITLEDLESSFKEHENDKETEKGEAAKYLISDPQKRVYSIASNSSTTSFNEEDDGSKSYFNARTRIGDETRQFIIVNDIEFIDELSSLKTPSKPILKQLMLKTVNLPEWWTRDVLPLHDYSPIIDDIQWLKGKTVIRLQDHQWIGIDGHSTIVIKEDDELGLIIERLNDGV